MSPPRRLPTAVCLAACTSAAVAGVYMVWSRFDTVNWDGNPLAAAMLGMAATSFVLLPLAWRRLVRRPPPPGLVLRWAFAAAVGLWFAYAAVAGVYYRGRVGCLFAGWAAFVAAIVWLAPAHTARPGRLGLAALAAAFALLLGEVSLRTVAVLSPGPLWARRSAHSAERLASHAFAVGERHFGFPTNALACYDDPFAPPSPTRGPVVAVIGDSFSASVVPHEFHYTTVAERAMADTAVWNVGWSALGPAEYRHLLEREVLPLRPDAVVVSLFLGNDLPETLGWTGFDRVLADAFDRGNVLLCEVPRRVWRYAMGAGQDVGSKLLGDLASARTWLHDPMREPPSFTEAAYLELETRRAKDACDAAHPSLPALRLEMRRMRDLCAGVPFGFVLIPDEFMVEDGLWQGITRTAQPGERWALRDHLVTFCRDEGIPCLDLLPVLRAVPPLADGDRHLYLRRDTHWNVRGNAVAGAAVATFVRELTARGQRTTPGDRGR
jgi:hypothetical protein